MAGLTPPSDVGAESKGRGSLRLAADGGQRSESGIRFAGSDLGGYRPPMSTITAVLDACPDGTLHLPLPPDLRGVRVRVEAKLEAAPSVTKSPVELRAIMRKLRDRNPFRGVSDPVAWQREAREDVRLPGRD